MSTLAQDNNGIAIPAMRLAGRPHQISATNSSARNSTAFDADTKIISVYATVPVRIKFGDDTVEAGSSDDYFPAGVYYDFSIADHEGQKFTHIAVLRDNTDGIVHISEKI